MMLRNIVLITLLVSSAWALPLEVYEDNSTENELDDNFSFYRSDRVAIFQMYRRERYTKSWTFCQIQTEIMGKTGHKLPGACWACKWAMSKLRQQISVGTSQGAIKTMLREVCDGIGFLQFVCKNLVANYLGTLVEELSTTDDAPTICRHIGIC